MYFKFSENKYLPFYDSLSVIYSDINYHSYKKKLKNASNTSSDSKFLLYDFGGNRMAYIDGRSKEISLDKVTNTTMLTIRGNINLYQ